MYIPFDVLKCVSGVDFGIWSFALLSLHVEFSQWDRGEGLYTKYDRVGIMNYS